MSKFITATVSIKKVPGKKLWALMLDIHSQEFLLEKDYEVDGVTFRSGHQPEITSGFLLDGEGIVYLMGVSAQTSCVVYYDDKIVIVERAYQLKACLNLLNDHLSQGVL